MLKVADRYFLGSFIKTLISSQVAFVVIFVVIDLVGFLDLFIDKKTPMQTIALYYWYFTPYIFGLVLPISMLMASLLTTGQFVRYGEITALKAAGVSLYRVFMPVLLFAFLVSVFAFWFSEMVVPDSQRKKADLKRYDIDKTDRRYTMSKNNIRLQDSKTRLVTIGTYVGEDRIAYKVNVIEREGHKIVRHVNAESMVPAEGGWKLREVILRDFNSDFEEFSEREELIIDDFSFVPEDLERVQVKPEEMNIFELKTYISKLQNMGSPYERWIVDFYHKIAFPLANFIVVLLGLPLATRNWRGGTAVGFGLCLIICFVYYIIMSFCVALGYKGTIPAVVSPWISNILIGSVGLTTLITAKK